MRHKVHMLNSVTYLNWTPSFVWCVVMCGSKNGHKKYICPKAIGPHAQIVLINLGSIVNISWGRGGEELITTLDEHKNLHLDKLPYIHMRSQNL